MTPSKDFKPQVPVSQFSAQEFTNGVLCMSCPVHQLAHRMLHGLEVLWKEVSMSTGAQA